MLAAVIILTIILTIIFPFLLILFVRFPNKASVYYSFYSILLAPVWFIISTGLILSILLFILWVNKKKFSKLNYKIIRTVLNFCRIVVFKYKVKAYNIPENFPEKLVLAGNHKAKFDPIFLINILKHPVSFTPKEALYKSPILRLVFKRLAAVKIYRDDIRKSIKELKNGAENIEKHHINYVVFPESSTHNKLTELIYDSHSAAYKIAQNSKSDLLPFAIKNALGFHSRWHKTIEIRFGNIIPYDRIKNMQSDEIAKLMEKEINKLFENKMH